VVLERRPRLAGVPGPGTGSVNDLHIQVAGDCAWAVAGYAWVGSDPEGAERGMATFVLQRRGAGWRIRHVHSSHVERWTR
jgi:ketosteroid isomerase-like protein